MTNNFHMSKQILKAYKIRLYPTEDQQILFA
ncbi:helix-turn-helix domain-containing protein, partial [Psychrobacter sp. PL15]